MKRHELQCRLLKGQSISVWLQQLLAQSLGQLQGSTVTLPRDALFGPDLVCSIGGIAQHQIFTARSGFGEHFNPGRGIGQGAGPGVKVFALVGRNGVHTLLSFQCHAQRMHSHRVAAAVGRAAQQLNLQCGLATVAGGEQVDLHGVKFHDRRWPRACRTLAGMNQNLQTGAEPSLKVIGLIGGMSWESSAEYYRLINQEVRQRLGALRSARLLMYSVDFGPIEQAQREGRWSDAAALLADAAKRLQAGGADCVLLCTNTMHKVADQVEGALHIPLLHIADPVGVAARSAGAQVLCLLGTRFTMEQPFMRERLEQQFGLQVMVPDEAERAQVHRIIYEELCVGQISDASRKIYQRTIESLAARGAQAVVLGCTEIGLLIKSADSVLPVLDTTALHASAAVDFALRL